MGGPSWLGSILSPIFLSLIPHCALTAFLRCQSLRGVGWASGIGVFGEIGW